ncbi:unnamed protein product [Caenorhabditis brenneri]
MKYLPFVVFVLVLSVVFVVIAEEWSKSSTCTSLENSPNILDTNCTIIARWRVTNDDECTESEYYKNTITSEVVSVSLSNGVAQCTKTPCDANEKIPVDCETAFGSRLSEIN